MSIPNDIDIATYAVIECGGCSPESLDEREGIKKGAKWMRTFLTKEPYISAPELLEALKNLLAVMSGEGGTSPNAQETARQVISKAEGKL